MVPAGPHSVGQAWPPTLVSDGLVRTGTLQALVLVVASVSASHRLVGVLRGLSQSVGYSSGAYHLPSDACHQPGPCDVSLIVRQE